MPATRHASASPRDAAVRIVRTLAETGYVAYLAGGCVRDTLLGVEPKDFDVATDAPPDKVRELFSGSRFVGEAFGVVLVRMLGHSIEVATFRAEWGYADGRRPDRVEFTDAQHDAQRRDFTVNGLFEDPLCETASAPGSGHIIDFVGGQRDLERKIIRAIGDPAARFGEDYLRMLRAVRFAARLGFSLHRGTAEAIRTHADKLAKISRERIGQEVGWMLTPRNAGAKSDPPRAALLMQKLGLDGPALNDPHADVPLPILSRAYAILSSRPRIGPRAYATLLAAWLLDRHGEPRPELKKTVSRWRTALCLSNDDRDVLEGSIRLAARAAAWPTMGVPARKRLLASAYWPQAWVLLRAMRRRPATTELVRAIGLDARPLLSQGVAPPPLVNGDDLIGLGLKPGPLFRRLLEETYDAQLDGSLVGRAEALEWVRRRAGGGAIP